MNIFKKKKIHIVLLSSFIAPYALNGGKADYVEGLDYFSALATGLAREIHHLNADLILKVPQHIGDQGTLFDYIFRNAVYYDAIIISPFEINLLIDKIKTFINKWKGRIPIFTIDKSFTTFAKDLDDTWKYYMPPYVTCKGKQGGAIAAQIFARKFPPGGFHPNNKFKVLVVEGLEGSKERIEGFEQELSNLFGKNNYELKKTDEKVPFQRLPSEAQVTRELIKIHQLIGKYDYYNGIFCCNDEMAIGANDALVKLGVANTKIVGFDGISDITYLIRKGDTNIIGTVDVRLSDQISFMSSIINYFLSNRRNFMKECIVDYKKPNPEERRYYKEQTCREIIQ